MLLSWESHIQCIAYHVAFNGCILTKSKKNVYIQNQLCGNTIRIKHSAI